MGEVLAGAGVLSWLVALSVFDIRDRRLPNWLTLPGAVVIVVAAVFAGRGLPAVAGGAALFAAYLVVHVLAPSALGAGDVKLAIGVGALTGVFGVDVWVLAAFAAPLLTAVIALLGNARSPVAHGPSMCAATLASVGLVVL